MMGGRRRKEAPNVVLGSALKMWIRPETSGMGDFLASAAVLGAGGLTVADFSRIGGTMYADRTPFAAQKTVHLDETSFYTTATQFGSVIGASKEWRRMSVLMVERVDPTSNNNDAAVGNNTAEISDAGGYHGVYLRSMGAGQYRVQCYQWDGALRCVSVPVSYDEGSGPIIVDAWYDGAQLNLSVYYAGTWTTATPLTCGGAQETNTVLRLGVGWASGKLWSGMLPESLHSDANMTTGERDALRAWLINRHQATAPAKRFISSLAKAWGNTRDGGTVLAPDYGGHSMQVFETDSVDADVRLYQLSTGLDDYMRAAILRGASGAVAPNAEILEPQSYPITTDFRTPVTIGGSSSRRLFLVGSPYGSNQRIAETWLRAGATTTHVTPPTDRVVSIDGQGGWALANDGYSATAGVIDGGAQAVLRAAYLARITAYVSNYSLGSGSLLIWFGLGVNDLLSGTSAANFQVALDRWVTDIRSIAAIATCPVVIQSITRLNAYEATSAPIFRSAAFAVAAARSLTYVDGLPIYATSDLSDGVHPLESKQPQHVTQIMALLATMSRASTGHVLVYGDSIVSGSAGTPQAWASARGMPMRLKQARASA
jgi:hypothetical protein